MASYPHNTASNKVKPWPAYFIVRTSGEVVPLIGVDELPVGTDLVGVPRALDLADTIGMLNLGVQRSSEAFYRILQHEEKVATHDALKTTKIIDPSVAPSKAAESSPQAPVKASSRSTAPPSSSSIHNIARTAAPHRSDPEVQTCRHWCTYGHCKWDQQCRYRHSMPLTLSGLQVIGLNDWPAWFRSLNPGYFANESIHPKPSSLRHGKGPVGNSGNRCCGDGCRGSLNLGTTHVKAERMRTPGRSVSERQKKEEVAERVIEKFRAAPTKEERKVGQVGREKSVSGSVMLERASMNDTKAWEDEGSETSEDEKENVIEEASGAKTSLLD